MIEAGRWHPLHGLTVLAESVPVLFGLASGRPAITPLRVAEPPPGANVAAGYGAVEMRPFHDGLEILPDVPLASRRAASTSCSLASGNALKTATGSLSPSCSTGEVPWRPPAGFEQDDGS